MSRSRHSLTLLAAVAVLAACDGGEPAGTTATTSESAIDTTSAPAQLPIIQAVEFDSTAVAAHELVEMTVTLEAEYENPFDQRDVSLDAQFTGPASEVLALPGFWDGDGSWLLRFAPTSAGEWSFSITVTDHRGTSLPSAGSLDVAESGHPGFLRVGNQVDPGYSPRYFAYEDGTAWYGRGHADLDMSLGGASPDGNGLRKFTEMAEIGENYEMWWPMWGNNFIQDTYSDYSAAQMRIIDFVIQDAQAKDIAIVYTIWGHQFLRTGAHEWGDDRWGFNGFNDLTEIAGFFTDPESWAWQENLYRYTIARWSYSPAIVMWQTVTEINGTESYEQTDLWHENVNAYFQEHDPYRHPTTATKSGAQDWPEGHAVMDVPQVHIYHVFSENPIADTLHFVEWARLMWDREEKPNWAGEYGNPVQRYYPELMHNANWASLAAGAALTPTEWNDQSSFGRFDEEMRADMQRFATFTDELPLVAYDPDPLTISSSDDVVRAWGLAGETGGVIWAQDFALETAAIEEIRADTTIRDGVVLIVDRLEPGIWVVTPYDTWAGVWGDEFDVVCGDEPCAITLPAFHSDIALRIEP